MEQKHLIIVDEQSQSATLDAIKNTLKNEGIDLVYKEINPANFQKRVGYNTSFDNDEDYHKVIWKKIMDRIDCVWFICHHILQVGIC